MELEVVITGALDTISSTEPIGADVCPCTQVNFSGRPSISACINCGSDIDQARTRTYTSIVDAFACRLSASNSSVAVTCIQRAPILPHTTTALRASTMATKATNAAPLVQQYMTSQKVGVVVSAGKMSRAVKVRIAGQEWNKTFRKHFPSHQHYTVSDPNNSLVEGDVVRITSGHRTSSTIRHVVTAIVAPFGAPVEDRPRVLNAAELDELRTQDRLLKDVRAAQRGREASVQRLALAQKQGVRIPTLEEAVEKLRVHEETEKTRLANRGGKEAHRGQGGQRETKRERRKAEKMKSREERHAAERAEQAKKQVV